VHISYDGKVHKTFRGPQRRQRYENEIRVLTFLKEKGCKFVPELLETNYKNLTIVTTNVGQIVQRMSEDKRAKIFAELESYGVQHDDPFVRNITYDPFKGRFCVIDFEFATILAPGYPPSPKIQSHPNLDTFRDAE
jgi:tRNA A-37 threonylcarbamoyl transferase component Bud32